ncbi:MAG: hypothetical protein LBI03_10175 [Clostridiales bacterium]|jgi:hypothetical protein|nr:hypothetical protein [Clostridiales bacterium]
MKILYVEDSPLAAEYRNVMTFQGRHEVEWVTNLADAEAYLTDNGQNYYGVIVLDLDLNKLYLPNKLRKRAKFTGEFAGWLFYLEVLSKAQQDRTIMLSGFTSQLTPEMKQSVLAENSKVLRIVDKNDGNRNQMIKEYIDSIEKGDG